MSTLTPREPLLSSLTAKDAYAYDVIVIGAGVAGLAFTLRLPPGLRVALLTKGVLGESNTRYAQGGLSAAVGKDDTPDLHIQDTLAAGAGLCDPAAVRSMVEGAPEAVEWLLQIGTHFDTDTTGELLLGREAAHSRRRVLHAGGDATGWEIERALVARVREDRNIDVYAGAFAIDLLTESGTCIGVLAQLAVGSAPVRLLAPRTVLAAGGAGQLWATTSNPIGATADGLAMAIRAGAPVADTEFVQFHPTVLTVPGTTPFLLTEAIRGEGAYLRGADGERFMTQLHDLAELAPRDVVARGIQRQMGIDRAPAVYLDLRHLDATAMRERFPTIRDELAKRGLDIATDLLPVSPAAHYFIGGVVAGPEGETGMPGLLAIGEASCTGVHGANRLASNSLLEGLVFGMRTADRIAREVTPEALPVDLRMTPAATLAIPTALPIAEARQRLQRAMSDDVAVVRTAAGLEHAMATVAASRREVAGLAGGLRRDLWELANMATAAEAVIGAALHRHESRGAHYREDHPDTDPKLAERHSLRFDGEWQYAALAEGL